MEEERLLEIPAGTLDVAGEDELECARRELAEEAELQAEHWSLLHVVPCRRSATRTTVIALLKLKTADRPS